MCGQGTYSIGPSPQDQQTPAPGIFVQTCALCHGGDARGTDRAPTLVNSSSIKGMSNAEISDMIRKGKGIMPAFPLPPPQVEELTRYVRLLNTTAATSAVPGDVTGG